MWEYSAKILAWCYQLIINQINWGQYLFCSRSLGESICWLEQRRPAWKNIDIEVENIWFWGIIWCNVAILGLWTFSRDLSHTFLLQVIFVYPSSDTSLACLYNKYVYYRFELVQRLYQIIFAQVRIFWNMPQSFLSLNSPCLWDW